MKKGEKGNGKASSRTTRSFDSFGREEGQNATWMIANECLNGEEDLLIIARYNASGLLTPFLTSFIIALKPPQVSLFTPHPINLPTPADVGFALLALFLFRSITEDYVSVYIERNLRAICRGIRREDREVEFLLTFSFSLFFHSYPSLISP